MKIRFYLSPQIGDGTYLNPYRSAITEYLDLTSGEGVVDVDNPARRIGVAYVRATDEHHAAIEADSRILTVSPLMVEGDTTPLDAQIGTLANSAIVMTKLEDNGIPTTWLTDSITIRDMLRYIHRLHNVSQAINGKQLANVLTIFNRNMTVTVGELPLTVRNSVKNWMQARGLAIGWITGTSTVREVLHYIMQNLGFGKIKVREVEF